ncbi:MAG: hypothetical protein FVQ85_04645 [Planctomycetes bacterium]|nr:hypothetical protein [Planctomycetota bacterium]
MRQLAADTGAQAGLAGVLLNVLEKQAILDTLAKTRGNREKAANILGIGERTLSANSRNTTCRGNPKWLPGFVIMLH